MENKVEEIMKEYKNGIESIEEKYDVKKVRKPKMLDTQELDDKIKYEKDLIAKLEYEGQDINKDMIEKAKARLELAESEKKIIEEKNEQKLDRYNESIEKREEKISENEKMKHSMVVLPSGREVTMIEKDKMDKQELKDKAIKGLTQESKAISEELLKEDIELKAINQELIDIDYDIRISTERNDDKIARRDELNQKLLELREEMKGLSDVQEKCNTYLEELKAPTKEEKAFMENWKETYKDEQQSTLQPESEPEPIPQPIPIPQPESEPEPIPQPESEPEPIPQPESKPEPIPQPIPIPQPESKPEPISQPIPMPQAISIPEIEFKLGKTASIAMIDKVYTFDTKQVKQAMNKSDDEISAMLDNYLPENERVLVQKLISKNEFDPTILAIINDAGAIYPNEKQKIVKQYLDKCLEPMEKSGLKVEYDVKELSKVNLFNRIFKRELNIEEKYKMVTRAYAAKSKNIAEVNGEYEISKMEKFISKITRNEIKALPMPIENKRENNFKRNMQEMANETNKEQDVEYIVEENKETEASQEEVIDEK